MPHPTSQFPADPSGSATPTLSLPFAQASHLSTDICTEASSSGEPSSVANMARVYADVNQNMPRSYWDYDSVNISKENPVAWTTVHMAQRRMPEPLADIMLP